MTVDLNARADAMLASTATAVVLAGPFGIGKIIEEVATVSPFVLRAIAADGFASSPGFESLLIGYEGDLGAALVFAWNPRDPDQLLEVVWSQFNQLGGHLHKSTAEFGLFDDYAATFLEDSVVVDLADHLSATAS
ncbi:hypothetical protein [Microbacterium sp. NPDC076895]|uniref:hypothetical protein n=1 Tax=Microbacterium sp. NPDC076895 TaxID=3154957 RepID=UPI0034415AA7